MRIIVTGARGQVGNILQTLLQKRKDEVLGLVRPEGDFTNREIVKSAFAAFKPELVIHAAAYIQVDQAETDPTGAYRVNGLGTQNLALSCAEADIPMLYVSTNNVFDGKKPEPYYEYDPVNPLSIYGKSKLAGELYVQSLLRKFYIVRTSWVFGPKPAGESNFITKMLAVARQKEFVGVVDDEISNPTYAPDLAKGLIELSQSGAYGFYHFCNQGPASRFEFAVEIFARSGLKVDLRPMKLADFKRPAPPLYQSAMHNFAGAENLGIRFRPWQEALAEYIQLRNSR